MAIPLRSILSLTERQIENSKIELDMKYGRTRKPFVDRWLNRPKSERRQAGRGQLSTDSG